MNNSEVSSAEREETASPARASFQAQRRTGATRLTVEFVVLFLAVTLSFLAEDLREAMGERRVERAVLEAIRQDLRTDLPIVREIVALDSAAAAAAQWLHRNWNRERIPADSVSVALQAQYWARVYAPTRAAYESAKGAGRFNLIRNADLRLAIGSHYETGQGEEKAVNDLVIDSALELQRALRPYVNFSADFPELCCASEVSLALPWREVRSDRVLRNTMLTSEMFRRLSEARLRAFEQDIRGLERRISAELEGQ